ncbi:MAG TPA: amidohydrolase family protein [Allosphingosinicella sp.]
MNLRNPEHLARVREVFGLANRHRLAITAHIATTERDYDPRATATIFLEQLLPAAADVPVQIAHMTGDSGFSETKEEISFGVFADAIVAGDPRTRNLYFDASGVVQANRPQPQSALERVARRMRQVGLTRILWASDRHAPNNQAPADAWKTFLERLPLTEAEFRDIADNEVRYPRRGPGM